MKTAIILALGFVFFRCDTACNARADIILIDPHHSEKERKLYEFALSIPDDPNVLTVVADGYGEAGGGLQNAGGGDLKPDEFARLVLSNSILKSDYRQIKLYACNVGQGDYVQKVADSQIFRGKCFQIIAPNAFVFVFRGADGKYGMKLCHAPDNDAGTSCIHPGGEWITFNSSSCRQWIWEVTENPQDSQGGVDVRVTIELSENAPPGGLLVTLTSDQPQCARPGPPALIPAGERTAVIDIATRPVDADTNFHLLITTSPGADKRIGGGTVKAARISQLRIPERTPGNKKGNVGKVVLDGPAGPNTKVDFGPDSSRTTQAIRHIPQFVTVPEGATEAEFKYDTSKVDYETMDSVTAEHWRQVTEWTTVTPN
jgi:hypothetical protein